MSKASKFVIFAFGAGTGSAAMWLYIKKKYEQIAQEEIDSVKQHFAKTRDTESITEQIPVKQKPDLKDYATQIQQNGYTNYSVTDKLEGAETVSTDKPYVIAPEDFGEADGYDTIGLTYYADRILADDDDELVEDAGSIVGFDSLGRFGEYEDDSVFVRNDRLKCDYEILLDRRKYSDVLKEKPRRVED